MSMCLDVWSCAVHELIMFSVLNSSTSTNCEHLLQHVKVCGAGADPVLAGGAVDAYSDVQSYAAQELILFSRADLERSIPSMVDGLKPGQRKIMFSCFKRNLKDDIKARCHCALEPAAFI